MGFLEIDGTTGGGGGKKQETYLARVTVEARRSDKTSPRRTPRKSN